MKFDCEYAGGKDCLCGACQLARKAIEEAEKITKEDVDKLFREAEETLKKEPDHVEGKNIQSFKRG